MPEDTSIETPIRQPDRAVRPGGPLHTTPLCIDGRYYDPLKPPHLFRAKDGTLEIRGNEISGDEHRSLSFWSKFNTEKIKQVTRDSMIENIKAATVSRRFTYFVRTTTTESGEIVFVREVQEQLAAYRILAQELGYEIKPYTYNKKDGLVYAEIVPIEDKK